MLIPESLDTEMHDLRRRALESNKTVSRKAQSKQASPATSKPASGSSHSTVTRVWADSVEQPLFRAPQAGQQVARDPTMKSLRVISVTKPRLGMLLPGRGTQETDDAC